MPGWWDATIDLGFLKQGVSGVKTRVQAKSNKLAYVYGGFGFKIHDWMDLSFGALLYNAYQNTSEGQVVSNLSHLQDTSLDLQYDVLAVPVSFRPFENLLFGVNFRLLSTSEDFTTTPLDGSKGADDSKYISRAWI